MVNVSREYIMKLKQRAEAAEQRQAAANPTDPSQASPQRRQDLQRREPSRHSLDAATSSLSELASYSRSSNTSRSRDVERAQDRHAVDSVNDPGTIIQPDKSSTQSRLPLHQDLSRDRVSLKDVSSKALSGGRAERTQSWSLPPSHDTSANFEEPNPDDFYGDSSTLSFMQAVQTTIISNSSPDSVSPDSNYRSGTKPRPARAVSFRLGVENCLPQRSLADDLVNSYFRYVHILYPFLHRPSFEAQYERTWVSGEQQDDQWLAMLNVIFALGIHFAYGQEDKSAASDRFFGYAQKLVSMEQFAHANLQTLQLLLLSGLYYQSTSRPNQTWNVIGLAIRIATTIGAHVDPMPSQYNPLQIEIRRRCWVLALNFGRPTAIPSTFGVSLPSNLDDEYITEEGCLEQPEHVRPKTTVFIKSVAFCSIMKDVLYTLYSPLNGSGHQQSGKVSPPPEFKDAVSLDKSLVEWFRGLPEYLKVGALDEMEEFRRTRNILLARFLNLRVLIHRPFASLWQQSSAVAEPVYLAPLDNSLHAMCVTVCKSAAIQLVNVISNNYYQGLSSAWWTDMNYLFTAATVLLAIEYECEDPEESDATESAFEQSLIILGEMQGRSSMASSYVTMLKKAKEAQDSAQIPPVVPTSSPRARSSNAPPRNSSSTSEIVSNGINLDEFLKDDTRADAPFPSWNMQDFFLVPWDMMMVDNPMPTFHS
ncbi:Fungal specific transcription factor domain-containing protein [Cladophialophora immunda]|nr:Fungal specific transcription factor domain-containing protein [Cladophialophora immunda]